MVEAVGGEVGPDRAVFLAVHHALFEAFEHLFLAFEIGLAFVVDFVEVNAHAFVGFVEAGIDPFVHAGPEGADFRVVVFPLHEHGAGFGHQGRCFFGFLVGHSLLFQGLELFLVVLVEKHVEVADKVVALLAGGFGGYAFAPFLPGEHRFADVDAAVVDNVGLDHAVAACGDDARQRVAEQDIAEVAQVEGLVGVGRRVFDHYQRSVGCGRGQSVVGRLGYVAQHCVPVGRLDDYVQEAFDNVETVDGRFVVDQPVAYFRADLLGRLAGGLDPGKSHYGQVALKLLAGGLRHDGVGGRVDAVEFFDGTAHGLGDNLVYNHYCSVADFGLLKSRKFTAFWRNLQSFN